MPVKLASIKNNPANPRFIRDVKFDLLKQSIKDFPRMMELRPIVVDENNLALGGNMRLKALQELGYESIPNNWVVKAKELTEEQKKEFIIKDNVGFGEWHWDDLANEWDADQLQHWGMDLPNWKDAELEEDEPSGYDQAMQWYLNIKCTSEKECQQMYEKFIKQGLDVKIVT